MDDNNFEEYLAKKLERLERNWVRSRGNPEHQKHLGIQLDTVKTILTEYRRRKTIARKRQIKEANTVSVPRSQVF